MTSLVLWSVLIVIALVCIRQTVVLQKKWAVNGEIDGTRRQWLKVLIGIAGAITIGGLFAAYLELHPEIDNIPVPQVRTGR